MCNLQSLLDCQICSHLFWTAMGKFYGFSESWTSCIEFQATLCFSEYLQSFTELKHFFVLAIDSSKAFLQIVAVVEERVIKFWAASLGSH